MRAIDTIALASLNRAKCEEFSELFRAHGVKVAPFGSFVRNSNFLEHVESAASDATYAENASRKCHAAFQAAKLPTLADDSGLEVDALQGKPGVHSAHFAKPGARESQDAANRRALLEQLKGKATRTARMRCVLVFQVEGVRLRSEGVCEGTILEKEAGDGGFGYDALFAPKAGGGKSFAELNAEEKNKMSHRALAVAEMVKLLRDREIQLVRP